MARKDRASTRERVGVWAIPCQEEFGMPPRGGGTEGRAVVAAGTRVGRRGLRRTRRLWWRGRRLCGPARAVRWSVAAGEGWREHGRPHARYPWSAGDDCEVLRRIRRGCGVAGDRIR